MTDQANTTVSDMLPPLPQSRVDEICQTYTAHHKPDQEKLALAQEVRDLRAIVKTVDATLQAVFGLETSMITERAIAAEVQLKIAKEALKPFADKSKAFDDAADEMGFARAFDEYQPKTNFTHGDLRKARAALQQAPE